MASQVIACACGRKLRMEDRHVGKTVRCPGCGSTFTVPAPPPAEEEVLEVQPVESVQQPPLPVARRAPEEDEPDPREEYPEEAEERRPRRKRRRPPAARGFLVGLAAMLHNEMAVRLLWIGGALGIGLLVYAFFEGRLSDVAKEQPQTLTMEQLASKGFGDNAHVIVTDFFPGNNFVYELLCP
jgi:hypothetical protein